MSKNNKQKIKCLFFFWENYTQEATADVSESDDWPEYIKELMVLT